MIKVAIYGKGGIGKSTVTANLAAAFAVKGYKVVQIGCDPKDDSTINLLGGNPLIPVMNFMRDNDDEPTIDEMVKTGFGGVECIETGGPTPGIGCAGRGIISTFNLIDDLDVFGRFIREGFAEDILIVTSGEKMALYAANNIKTAVDNFADRGYAKVKGVVLNHRNVENETEKVQAFADEAGIPIVGEIPRSQEIIDWEDQGKTVIEGNPESDIAKRFFALADYLIKENS